ncbi:C4b-binding protein alpha chain-like [Psammomys obesus]|uniref:C4b-binding protein alpha chain-like n=1 Tax=Psammomys obesus TaxID=48139 RepID=UPI0024536DD1|nr:C4b-binding protein alpha chain-like [Psammomys obesus]
MSSWEKLVEERSRHHHIVFSSATAGFLAEQLWAKQQQAMHRTRAPRGTLQKTRGAVAWPFSRLCRVCGPTLFQMALTAALWVAVFGKCGPPPDLPYALPATEMNQTDFESQTVLRYNCRPGYSRATSSQTVYCTPEGKWYITIICVKKSCRNPGDLHNGHVEVKTDFSFGSQIEFSCSEGKEQAFQGHQANTALQAFSPYFLSFNSYLSFFHNSVEITCAQPNISHGIIISGLRTTYKHKDAIMFACKKGSILRGSNLIRCEADGNWNPSPICELSGCTNIPDIPHAFWLHSSKPKKDGVYAVGTVLRYRCQSGYVHATKESMTVICQKDFSWSPFQGCKALCPRPAIRNGMLSANKEEYIESENVTVQCYSGFAMLGSQIITCSENGAWYPEVPKCEQEALKYCDHVFTGKRIMQCLPNSNEVKMALEVFKLSLDIELLKLQIDKAKQTTLEL